MSLVPNSLVKLGEQAIEDLYDRSDCSVDSEELARAVIEAAVPILRKAWEEELLSNEAHEAALDAQIRVCGRASDRATEAALKAAIDTTRGGLNGRQTLDESCL